MTLFAFCSTRRAQSELMVIRVSSSVEVAAIARIEPPRGFRALEPAGKPEDALQQQLAVDLVDLHRIVDGLTGVNHGVRIEGGYIGWYTWRD